MYNLQQISRQLITLLVTIVYKYRKTKQNIKKVGFIRFGWLFFNVSERHCSLHITLAEESVHVDPDELMRHLYDLWLTDSNGIFRFFQYNSATFTYMLALFTHNCVGEFAYKDAVHEVHFYTFLSIC